MNIKSAKKYSLLLVAVIISIAGVSDRLQPVFALTNAGVINALGVPFTENFDTLPSTTSATWTNNSTIPGWYTARTGNGTTIVVDAGSNTAGNLYSYGPAGNSDRALGSIGSGNAAAGSFFWGARLSNATGSTITSLTVSYVGEQWRSGGTAGGAQTVAFSYRVGSGLGNAVTDFNTGGTAVPQLDFTSPITTTSSGTALNGNLAANRVAISFTIPNLAIADGQEILLRWSDPDHGGTDHGLAIDDLSVTAAATPVDPAPTASSPLSGATNVAVNSTIAINFSESINATASAFSLQCPSGTAKTFTQTSSPATSITLTPTANLPYGTTCTVTVNATQVTDEDTADPLDQMSSNYVFSFTTVPPAIDPAPTVTNTSPSNLATGVSASSNIVVTFSEAVQATSSAFVVNCGGLQSVALTGSGSTQLTLNPVADLPYATTCNVTVTANQVSDVDTNDPDDLMAADFHFSFTTSDPPLAGSNVVINEIDADTPASDTAEFVELFGAPNTPLDGLVVVFYAGFGDPNTPDDEEGKSYAAFGLNGYTTDANGYFTLGNPGVPGVDLVFAPGQFGLLQNGADAVALYAGNAADFQFPTPVTTTNLLDAIVYGTDDADDPVLKTLLNSGQEQVNESAGGSSTTQSSARCENGTGGQRNTSTYLQVAPTPDGANVCPAPPTPGVSTIVISQVYGGGGNSNATYKNDYVELYNRSGATVDVNGWSLQYASATGSGWDFNKQPLAGTIGPDQYYLVSLAGGATGAALPPANITGGLINMGAGTGKIALVDTLDALEGTCPKFNPHLRDLVGYGTGSGSANCREGVANAPGAGNNATAVLRKLGGATDTDENSADFATGPPNPRQSAPIVELGPYVANTDPRNNATDAPRDATILVTFTEPVTVVDPWFTITCATTGLHDSFTQAASGQLHAITPNVNFMPGEQCTVTVLKDQVHDVDTNDSGPNSDTMAADKVWSFTVASGTAPPYLSSVHLTMGNPSDAVADIGQANNFLMEKPEFTLSYNRDYGRPNWVSWHLSPEWYGTLDRIDTFRADPAVPADWYRVQSFDFTGSGFDRGHMTPNADRDKETSTPINQATFLMSNMVAQAPDNNQGPWAKFEDYLRSQADLSNEVYIVSGAVGIGGTGSNGGTTATIAGGHVTVPERTWKVALILPLAGGDDVSHVSCSTRTIAINMPNVQGIRNNAWETYLTTVDAVEALTGYDLFSNLPLNVQACVEAGTNGNNPPLDTTPPSISCDSPDGLWHAGNINLSCHASDSGSGLANLSDTSFTLSTGVVSNSEDENAGTNTRTVCDVAGNCATAASIVGNKIDRLAPTITQLTPSDSAWHADNVVFAHTATDGGSGLLNGTDASFSLATSVTTGVEDGNASTDSRAVCDAVGNCASAGPIGGNKIDRLAPFIVVVGLPDTAWHANNVSLARTASDNGSGLANSADAAFSLVTSVSPGVEDANASTDSRSVCDAVGNCATADAVAGNMIDRKAPAITLITPVDGETYKFNKPINADYFCGDGGSGLGNCTGTVPNGTPIDTWTKGVKTFAVTATDAVGNTATRTVTYTSSPGGKDRQ